MNYHERPPENAASSETGEERDRAAFQELKPTCVALLRHSQLTASTIPIVIPLLTDLLSALRDMQASNYVMPSSLVSYTAFPLLSFLRRNELASIPDRVLELTLSCLSILCESWWWTCDRQTWEQLFMFCSSVIEGIGSRKEAKARDDETKIAAVQCLIALTRPRNEAEVSVSLLSGSSGTTAAGIFRQFTTHAQSPTYLPIVGRTLSSLIISSESFHRPLQLTSLQELGILLNYYMTEDIIPSVLPGVVSSMIRLALGSSSKGRTNGDIVTEALAVMQVAIVRSIGDDVCLRAGVVRDFTKLEDLVNVEISAEESPGASSPLKTARTVAWLHATSSQLLVALNTITSLVTHPNPSALSALVTFSTSIIGATSLTLPQIRPLLASFLLTLSISSYPRISSQSREALRNLLSSTSKTCHQLLDTVMQITKDNLSVIPRLLLSHSDSKVEHIAGIIEAIGTMASLQRKGGDNGGFAGLSAGIGRLFGPMGGVEKWGWRILSVLEFQSPAVVLTGTSVGQLMLEAPSTARAVMQFPELVLQHASTRSMQAALERMFVALGSAAGEEALFAVEWFVSVGKNSPDARSVAALWCACRLMEGISGMRLSDANATPPRPSRKVEKVARGLARSMADIWNADDSVGAGTSADWQPSFDLLDATLDSPVQYQRGLVELDQRMGILKHKTLPAGSSQARSQILHSTLRKSIALHVLCVSAGILQARFTPLLIHTLYPVLHSIVSSSSFSSVTGFAALEFIALNASYASPANLLLSNFDYALDAVSRRLSREHLDADAMKVLVLLVRLVGPDVVHRASDLVEECFSRLDEYHGYETIVDGLVEVLGEVVKVIEHGEDTHVDRETRTDVALDALLPDAARIDAFESWFKDRHKVNELEVDDTDYGPAPRKARGPSGKEAGVEDEAGDKAADGPIDEEKPPTPVQALTRQIVSRSIYFLTHRSSLIRVRILKLLASAVPVLPESVLLQSIHSAWPFILNRFSDSEAFVVSAAASLVEALAVNVGSWMHMRVWDDIWPIFRRMLKSLEVSDTQSALAHRGIERAGPESVYANSFALYYSIIKTMTASARHVQANDNLMWEVLLAFRRFLHRENHVRLQALAVEFYITAAKNNEDAVWLALEGTMGRVGAEVLFLRKDEWDIEVNMKQVYKMEPL
ncbi:ARM repeat-containing protein [Vararia minispora EC-137]|uniref:ARM repeat-containing protein n=1 Tax=Vararia minispora EC-137 TaxID=1314806 RepID=A0ACB8QFT6_9AGAM|nr:ARM repeat-containing protein [Vararia minispora EC-137]